MLLRMVQVIMVIGEWILTLMEPRMLVVTIV